VIIAKNNFCLTFIHEKPESEFYLQAETKKPDKGASPMPVVLISA